MRVYAEFASIIPTQRSLIEHVVLRAADGEPEHCISIHIVPLRLNVDQVRF